MLLRSSSVRCSPTPDEHLDHLRRFRGCDQPRSASSAAVPRRACPGAPPGPPPRSRCGRPRRPTGRRRPSSAADSELGDATAQLSRSRPGSAARGPRGRRTPPSPRRSASAASARIRTRPASSSSAAAIAFWSASGSGTTWSSARGAGAASRGGRAVKPRASGTATEPTTSAGSSPVVVRGGDQHPACAPRAHRSSTIAAVNVASTWSATASVTLVPSSLAVLARLRGDRGGELTPLPRRRARPRRHRRLGLP